MKALIDWPDFLRVAFGVTGLYYVIIGIRFFKYEILRLFGIRKISSENASSKTGSEEVVEG